MATEQPLAERSLQRRHIEAVVAVGRLQSVHGAARALGCAQPAVSRLITEAEALVAMKLFDRTSQGSRLTAEGIAFLDRAQFVLRALQRLSEKGAARLPVIELGCIPRAMHSLMPGVLERLQTKDAPQFRLQVTEGSSNAIIEATSRAALDFAIARHELGSPRIPRRFVLDHLYNERIVVICGVDNAAIPETRVRLDSLAKRSWVLPIRETASRATFDRVLLEEGMAPIVPVIEVRSFESNLALVAGTRFMSIAPESIARRHAAFKAVRIVRLRKALPASPVVLIYDRSARDDAILEGFRRTVLAVAGQTRRMLANGHQSAQ
ncbi:MAG: LysR substrate-binding domain-containing protein [Casimicrobiaceae bacterium]